MIHFLQKEQLIAFATQKLTTVLGSDIPQCFLAGGAYKTLIHGRPPRDLDIWPETIQARQQLLSLLGERGDPLPPAPGAERFLLPSGLVEVPFQIETMEKRLARFDLGLSCIAVVFREGRPHSFFHPLAQESIARQEILLIGLARSDLALATLVRARRYANDLNYSVPKGVEELLWKTHLEKSRDTRREQILQLQFHYGTDTWGVTEEAESQLLHIEK